MEPGTAGAQLQEEESSRFYCSGVIGGKERLWEAPEQQESAGGLASDCHIPFLPRCHQLRGSLPLPCTKHSSGCPDIENTSL